MLVRARLASQSVPNNVYLHILVKQCSLRWENFVPTLHEASFSDTTVPASSLLNEEGLPSTRKHVFYAHRTHTAPLHGYLRFLT